jgi:hypothetical protein
MIKKIFLIKLLILILAKNSYLKTNSAENNFKVGFEHGWYLGTSYYTQMERVTNFRLEQFVHIAKNSWMPLDIELKSMTICLQQKKVSYVNMLIMPIAFVVAYACHTDDPFFNVPFMLVAAPQLLGNFNLHLFKIGEIASFFIGETTDYFIYRDNSAIYTESNIGVKLSIKKLVAEIELNKPWLNGYLEKEKFGISTKIGLILAETNK